MRDYAAAARLLSEALGAVSNAEEHQRALLLDLRSGCALQTQEYAQALDDALLCTKLSPEW